MSNETAKPVLFLKDGCPHCLKVRLFLLEAGLLDRVILKQFTPGDASEVAIRAELAGKVETLSFPAALMPEGDYMTESDAIIARLATMFDARPARLPIFSTYADAVLPRYIAARKELRMLQQQS